MADVTRIEADDKASKETVVEPVESADGRLRTNRITLPAALSEQYEYLRDLPSGAEADAIVLRSKESGEEVFLKFYRPGFSPDAITMLLLKSADPCYVARLIDYNDSEDGCWEIQEYYPDGSLENWVTSLGGILSDVQIEAIARELTEDLTYLHGLGSGIAHRDLKPSNILVKSTDPISLVLADFGLAKAQQAITHLTKTVKGTWQYAAPEVQSKQSSAKSDWFSLGAILYEYSTGRPLFSDADGNSVSDDEARARCLSGYYSTELVENKRIKMLVSGLLCWDKDKRWGANEVERWLNGESPDVSAMGPISSKPSTSSAGTRLCYRPTFCSDLASNFPDLARMIRENWEPFADLLTGRPDEKLVRFIEAIGQSEEYAMAAQDLLRIIPGLDSAEYKLVQIQVLLDPATTPMFRGLKLDNESLKNVIAKAREGEKSASEWISAAVEARVFGALSEILGSRELAKVDYCLARWSAQVDETLSLIPEEWEEWKSVSDSIKETINPILMECAISLEAGGQSEIVDSIWGVSEELCGANYGKESERVAPYVELLASAKKEDVGHIAALNSLLSWAHRAEFKRCSDIYETAKRDISLRRYGPAIEGFKSIPFYQDADALRSDAEKRLEGAKQEYLKALEEAESAHFENALELFLDLKDFGDSSEMANAIQKAISFMADLPAPERNAEEELSKIIEDMAQKVKDREEIDQRLADEEEGLKKLDDEIEDAKSSLESLCAEKAHDWLKRIGDLEFDLADAEDDVRAKSEVRQSAHSALLDEESGLRDLREELQVTKKSLKNAKMKSTMMKEKIREQEQGVAKAEERKKAISESLEAAKLALESSRTAYIAVDAKGKRLVKPIGFKKELAAAKEAAERAQQEYASLRTKNNDATKTLGIWNEQLADFIVSDCQASNDIFRLEKKIEGLEAKEALLCAELPRKRDSLDIAEKELGEARASCSVIQEKISEAKSELDQVWGRVWDENSGKLDGLTSMRSNQEEIIKGIQKEKEDIAPYLAELIRTKHAAVDKLAKIRAASRKRKIDPRALLSCCKIFTQVTERDYRRYLGISKAIARGDVIRLGTYESEQLEWTVLKTENGKALLFGPILGSMALDESGLAKTWDECTLYHWLNHSFFTHAFTESEQDAIRFGGKESGFCVSVPAGNEMPDMEDQSIWKKCDQPWWTSRLDSGPLTEDYKEYAQHFVSERLKEKEHRKEDCVKKIIKRAKELIDNTFERTLFDLRTLGDGSSKDDLIIEDLSGYNSTLLPRIRASIARDMVKGWPNNGISSNTSLEGAIILFESKLRILRMKAFFDYEGNPFGEKKFALKVIDGEIDKDGFPLTDEALVRPMIWLPYYQGLADTISAEEHEADQAVAPGAQSAVDTAQAEVQEAIAASKPVAAEKRDDLRDKIEAARAHIAAQVQKSVEESAAAMSAEIPTAADRAEDVEP